jgi:hypothetical protein
MSLAKSLVGGVFAGAAAGAAGTTALNAVTYLDIAIRGRATSSAPQDAVTTLAGKVGVDIPGDGETRDNRVSGLGPLLGIVTGVGVGALAGLLRAAGLRLNLPLAALGIGTGAMLGSDAPMARLGISDPKTWSATDWAADAVPHLAYGLATAGVLQAIER